MSISFQIPQTSRFIPTTNKFMAAFNVPTPGFYDFADTPVAVALRGANVNQHVLDLFNKTVYLIERISVGGDLPVESYREAISTMPTLTLRRTRDKQIVYKTPMPIPNFIDDQDVTAWAYTAKGDDSLILTLSGSLIQTAALVGITDISIFVSYSIYAIESTDFAKSFLGILSPEVGESITGAVR